MLYAIKLSQQGDSSSWRTCTRQVLWRCEGNRETIWVWLRHAAATATTTIYCNYSYDCCFHHDDHDHYHHCCSSTLQILLFLLTCLPLPGIIHKWSGEWIHWIMLLLLEILGISTIFIMSQWLWIAHPDHKGGDLQRIPREERLQRSGSGTRACHGQCHGNAMAQEWRIVKHCDFVGRGWCDPPHWRWHVIIVSNFVCFLFIGAVRQFDSCIYNF